MSSPISVWRKSKKRFLLEGVVCTSCDISYYPGRYLCPCGSQQFKPFRFSGDAILKTFTKIEHPPHNFKQMAPYCIGLVKLVEGPCFVTQLTDVDLEELKIGMEMRAVLKKYVADGAQGIISYGIKFMPKDI